MECDTDMADQEIMVALVRALRMEFEKNLRKDAGDHYSAAMMSHGLTILERAMEPERLDTALPLNKKGFQSADKLARAIRTRQLTEKQMSSLRELLEAHVKAKLSVSNPDILKDEPVSSDR